MCNNFNCHSGVESTSSSCRINQWDEENVPAYASYEIGFIMSRYKEVSNFFNEGFESLNQFKFIIHSTLKLGTVFQVQYCNFSLIIFSLTEI